MILDWKDEDIGRHIADMERCIQPIEKLIGLSELMDALKEEGSDATERTIVRAELNEVKEELAKTFSLERIEGWADPDANRRNSPVRRINVHNAVA